MTRNEALIQAIEFDLMDYHRGRMSQRAGVQMQLLRDAQHQLAPNADRIARIRDAMTETLRNQLNTALTVDEVIEPLRRGVSIQSIKLADQIMADPASWKAQGRVEPEKKTLVSLR